MISRRKVYYSWRITKYDPQYRDIYGRYIKDEWISIGDIGRVFDGQRLSLEEYLQVEDKYVQAVIDFAECLGVPSLHVVGLEKYAEKIRMIDNTWYTEELKELYPVVEEGMDISNERIRHMCKLILRNNLWCKLEFENRMFVHFGYDYYMYIVSDGCNEGLLNKISANGLFVEPIVSPYLDL